MAWVARVTFADFEDGKRLYLAGAPYPRDGLTVSEERLAKLAGSDNLAGYPLIEFVPDKPAAQQEEAKPDKPVRKRVKKNA